AAGLRPSISFVGGDLVSTNQDVWLAYMADHMGDVLDGWSIHVYWDYTDTTKLASRLTDTRAQVDAMPAAKRKPLYVTEFGVRGITPTGTPSPGTIDGKPTESTITNAFQHGWFDVLAAHDGFVTALKWDAYFAKYDNGTQRYAMIDAPDTMGVWALTPVYALSRMIDRAVPAGSDVVALDGTQAGVVLTAFRGPSGELTVLGVNTSKTKQDFDVGGLLPATTFHALVWNAAGDGTVSDSASNTGDVCTVALSLPPTSAFAVTSIAP
ncbi:MAG TPA: hypothetical protein VIF62_26015, partial [Labilithrix sp.]